MNECVTKPTDANCQCPNTHSRVLIAQDSIQKGNPPRNHFYCSYDSLKCQANGGTDKCHCSKNPTYHNCSCGADETKYFLLKNSIRAGDPIIDLFTCCPKDSTNPRCLKMEENLRSGYIPPLPGSQEEREALEKLSSGYEIVNVNGQLVYRVKPKTDAPVVKLEEVDPTVVSTEKSDGLQVNVISPQIGITVTKEEPTDIVVGDIVSEESSAGDRSGEATTEEVISVLQDVVKQMGRSDIGEVLNQAQLMDQEERGFTWWGISRTAWMIILVLFLMLIASIYFIIFRGNGGDSGGASSSGSGMKSWARNFSIV